MFPEYMPRGPLGQTPTLHAPFGVEHAPNSRRRCWPSENCSCGTVDCPSPSPAPNSNTNRRTIHRGDLVLSGRAESFIFRPNAPLQDVGGWSRSRAVTHVPCHTRWAHWGCVRGSVPLLGDVRASLDIRRDGSAASSGCSPVDWSGLAGYDDLSEEAKRTVRRTLLPGGEEDGACRGGPWKLEAEDHHGDGRLAGCKRRKLEEDREVDSEDKIKMEGDCEMDSKDKIKMEF